MEVIDQTIDKITEVLNKNQEGFDWKPILSGMKTFSLISIQPATLPMDNICFYNVKRIENIENIPELSINIESRAVSVVTRTLNRDKQSLQLDREIFATIIAECEDSKKVHVTTTCDLKKDITLVSIMIHRNSQRMPADWILLHPNRLKDLLCDDELTEVTLPKLKILTDDKISESQILIGRSPSSPFDANLVWSPFKIEEVEDKIKIRHKISLVKTNDYYLMEVK